MNKKSVKQNNKLTNRRSLYVIIKDHQLVVVLVTLIIFVLSIYYINPYGQEYAIINKDGYISHQTKAFVKYGLFVEKKEIDEGYGKNPIYILSFKNEPSYFEISIRKALLREIDQIGANKYMLKIYRTGGFGGNYLVDSDFRIQAY
jgi:hypothetical protein